MSNTTDNFDALWANLREQVIAARTIKEAGYDLEERPLIYTDHDGIFQSKYGANVGINRGDEDGATIYISSGNSTLNFNCQPSDLYTIAAHCIAAAMEVEEAQAEAQAIRPNTTAR